MYVIGLISGTSVDGVDAALVELAGSPDDLSFEFIAGKTVPYPPQIRDTILSVCRGETIALADLADLDDAIAQIFAQAAIDLQTQTRSADLVASHGQTVFHRPPPCGSTSAIDAVPLGYSLQLGRGDLIAHLTELPTISNFRQADIAQGGEGAPLVPPVDACLLSHPTQNRCVQNIGGIGNVAYLPAKAKHSFPTDSSMAGTAVLSSKVLGWDTGPGNTLIDIAVQTFTQGQQTYDRDGAWAAQGTPHEGLIEQWLEHPYFLQLPPKSSGREVFGWDFFERCRQSAMTVELAPADLLATLTDFTAQSIVRSYQQFLPALPEEVLLCGGGSRNGYLRRRIQHHLGQIPVLTTDDVGLPSDYKEAIAFAVLGYWHCQGIPGNLPSVTGARRPVVLGERHGMAPDFL